MRSSPTSRTRREAAAGRHDTRRVWLRALTVQAIAWIALFALSRWLPLPGLAALIGTQATLAALLAWRMHHERWWIALHALFGPLGALALGSGIDPRWWLAALALTLLLFWGTPATRVPLYLSGRAAVDTLDGLVRRGNRHALLDIGCGLGSVITPLARRHPQLRITGIEAAPLPWLVSRLRTRGAGNVSVLRGDFFAAHWGDYDLVYAFLSPHPMTAVWDKARREMRPDALLVSKDFTVPEVMPLETIALPGGSSLYVYAPSQAGPTRAD